MKKSLSVILVITIVFVLVMGSSSCADSETGPYTITEPYKYPVTVGTDEWSKLNSKEAKIKACEVSEDILNSMTTEALIETVVNYPLLVDMFAYSSIEIGVGYVSQHFKGIRILETREDAVPLLTKYAEDKSKSEDTQREYVDASAILEYLQRKNDTEKVLNFLKENPDPLSVIENPASANAPKPCYDNPDIPKAIYDFLYLYYGSFVSLEAPDFSALEANGCSFDGLTQMLRYNIARDRAQLTFSEELTMDVTAEQEADTYLCEVKWSLDGSGGVEYWRFEMAQNDETKRLEINNFEYVQRGQGGLYPGLENIFADISWRYPEYADDAEMLADLGIAERLLEIYPW